MMRSLFSGVAGLKTHQTRMDVIGNNIANVNTVAYKSQSATFQELMYQNTQNASAANQETGRGGINAKQIGLGSSLAAINTNIALSGSSQSTGNAFDVQIAGDAFFIVSDGAQNHFTRAGAFYVDGVGNLAMTSNGYNVMGWQPNADGSDVLVDTVSPLKIMSAENLVSAPEQTTAAYIDGVIDKNDSNVLSTEGRLVNVSVYDSLGYSYIVQFSVSHLDTSKTPAEPFADPGEYTMTPVKLLDSKGRNLFVKGDKEKGNPTGNESQITLGTATTMGPITIKFDPKTGALDTKNNPSLNFSGDGKKATIAMKVVDGASGDSGVKALGDEIELDLMNMKMYDNNGTSTVAGHYGNTDGRFAGRKKGALSGVAIQQDGKIYGSYDNGTSKLLGQIAVTSFANPSGLEKIGDNLYDTTQNSGAFDGIGKDITADGGGSMKTGVLEMSNVDLSGEFTEMITTQRGFQANSRIITVSDTMLEELINLKR